MKLLATFLSLWKNVYSSPVFSWTILVPCVCCKTGADLLLGRLPFPCGWWNPRMCVFFICDKVHAILFFWNLFFMLRTRQQKSFMFSFFFEHRIGFTLSTESFSVCCDDVILTSFMCKYYLS